MAAWFSDNDMIESGLVPHGLRTKFYSRAYKFRMVFGQDAYVFRTRFPYFADKDSLKISRIVKSLAC